MTQICPEDVRWLGTALPNPHTASFLHRSAHRRGPNRLRDDLRERHREPAPSQITSGSASFGRSPKPSPLLPRTSTASITPGRRMSGAVRKPGNLHYDGFQSPAAGPASGRVSPESHDAIDTINAWS